MAAGDEHPPAINDTRLPLHTALGLLLRTWGRIGLLASCAGSALLLCFASRLPDDASVMKEWVAMLGLTLSGPFALGISQGWSHGEWELGIGILAVVFYSELFKKRGLTPQGPNVNPDRWLVIGSCAWHVIGLSVYLARFD